MTDEQQQQERPTDIEDGVEVGISSDSSAASADKGLYSRMSANQMSVGALSVVTEDAAAADDVFTPRKHALSDDNDDTPVSRMSVRSTVTTKYDLDGKGYLDDTEKAMRALDTSNRGMLDMHKVYTIMKELQEQQRELHVQQKSFANLKKVVVLLACFSMVLALANLGTAFAAATLAKDTTVDAASGALLAKGTGEAISTVGTGTVLRVEEAAAEEEDGSSGRERRTLRIGRRMQDLSGGLGGDLGGGLGGALGGGATSELRCHEAVGRVGIWHVASLVFNIARGADRVTIQYRYTDESTGKKRKDNIHLNLEHSDWDENIEDPEGGPRRSTVEIGGTRLFPCAEDELELCSGFGYRTLPEYFLFECTEGSKKCGMFNCMSEAPIPLRDL